MARAPVARLGADHLDPPHVAPDRRQGPARPGAAAQPLVARPAVRDARGASRHRRSPTATESSRSTSTSSSTACGHRRRSRRLHDGARAAVGRAVLPRVPGGAQKPWRGCRRIWPHPVEVADAIPFDRDERHASYDPGHAELLWRAMLQVDRVLKGFQTGFVGKASPVHLFWGGFDLATTRFSGRPAPRHPGGIPNCPDWVMEEAESRQNVTAGWWPLSEAGPGVLLVCLPAARGLPGRRHPSGGGVLRRSPRRVPVAVRRGPRVRGSGRGRPRVPAVDLRGGRRPRRLGSPRPRARWNSPCARRKRPWSMGR